ncbi:WD40-repeat-containing domain protein [Mortierella sp. GBAus27b]|nr:WD40-repeat-containing domain protein [Mortierella sp. GBAus27b]
MVFGTIISSPRASLSLHQVLEVANTYLDNARNATDSTIALVFCHDAELSLSQLKKAVKHSSDKDTREDIAVIYASLGKLLDIHGHQEDAQAFYKKSEKLGGNVHLVGQPIHHSRTSSLVRSIKSALHSTTDTSVIEPSFRHDTVSPHKQQTAVTLPRNIFPTNIRPPTIEFEPPEPDARLNSTSQLACCLSLLRAQCDPEDILLPSARNWLQITQGEPDEKERLKTLATDVIRAFKRDEIKDAKAVSEVVCLAPVLDSDDFRYLLKEFYSGIDHSGLLDVHQLGGLSYLIQGADPGYLDADDLVKVLDLISKRLQDTHQQSPQHLYQLTLAVSNVLDAMADTNVKGLDREKTHEPLKAYLDGLKESSDPYLVYQAAYAYQALLCVPDNESLWQATLRRTGKIVKGISGLVSAVKSIDLNAFVEGLGDIQQGLAGASEVVQLVKDAYEGVSTLAKGGKTFFDCLKEGMSFSRKCAWYTALRGADTLIEDGQLAEFRKLVCEAPCRYEMAFQWGVCQRLGEIAVNTSWDLETRRGALGLLGEMYKDDNQWGQHASVKQWILDILMQLSSKSGGDMQYAMKLLNELQNSGDASKQALYRSCRENGPGTHPLKIGLPTIGSPSLIDRVQERPDVEGQLRQLRRQRMKEHGSAVYISPQAKVNLQARDDACFPLMEKIELFLGDDQMVFLLLGDSGAGKSTFNRELEHRLWLRYKKGGTIPLHINLPAIDKPEHDMIAKQLRKVEFTEPQIRELKQHRTLVLICDGYDESQQTHNLYTSNRLNQPGEWNVKMVISCRSEYLGVDYRDRFQPNDRNQRSETSSFQEAVITPFSVNQVQEYINQYVFLHRPLWEANDYKKALDQIPSLKELVRNPFLMSLSLEVLPRMVDPGQDLSTTHITRVSLYDQFIEHWLERGKKRLGEKNMSPQARAAYENLIDEGFTRNGITYLKNLSAAIYREQDGQPIVSYSRYKDESSWKSEFFSREDEKQHLREACPMIRGGNQYRFIHKSLLEYGVALAVFDPQDMNKRMAPELTADRRGSADSVFSFVGLGSRAIMRGYVEQDSDLDSPLAWRSFINDPSVLQFLEERVQQEPLFKQQLLNCIERSKEDVKWRTAAANAITILVRVGVQFSHADMRGIRIPGADISYGVFDSTQFQGADLRQVDLRGAWLQNTDFTHAQMTGAQFGELPYLNHDGSARICRFSPDEKRLSVSLNDGTINVYSTSTWEGLLTLNGHAREALSLEYSLPGTQLASGGYDCEVRLWNMDTGECSHVLSGHHDWVRSVAYSPAGTQVASASDDCTVRLWNAESGECCYILIGHTNYVYCVVYSPDGNQIASCGSDTISLWNIESMENSLVLRGHEGYVTKVVYSPLGDRLASAGSDRAVRLWNTRTGECTQVLSNISDEDKSSLIVFSPKFDRFATAGSDSTVQIWDVESEVCLHTLSGNIDITEIAYSPLGDMVASAHYDYTMRLWDAEAGIIRQTFAGHSSFINSVIFTTQGNQVVSASNDGTVRVWDIGSRISRHILVGHSSAVREVKHSPKRGQLATCGYDGTVRLWNTDTGSNTRILTGHQQPVYGIAYSPEGNRLVSGSEDNTLKVWDVETGKCLQTLTGHTDYVRSVNVSPDGRQIASSGGENDIRLWDSQTNKCSQVLIGHFESVCKIMYSPQSNMIASSSDDKTIRLWDTTTGECTHIIIGHTSRAYTLVFSPDGSQIAFGCVDGSMRLWDIEKEACIRILTGHSNEINNIAYSSQGDLLVSGSDDETLRLWGVPSGQCLDVIQVFQSPVYGVEWIEMSDANYVAASCANGAVGMWNVVIVDGQYRLRLHWTTTKGKLYVDGAIVQGVQGLSRLNKELLKQRGSVGEPVDHLRDTTKKLTSRASVVSKLKAASSANEGNPVEPVIGSIGPETRVEQTNDPEVLEEFSVAFMQTLKDKREEVREILGWTSQQHNAISS